MDKMTYRAACKTYDINSPQELLDVLYDYNLQGRELGAMMEKYGMQAKPTRNEKGEWICPSCGQRVNDRYQYCHFCGKRLGGSGRPPEKGRHE